jgi:molybdopterin biosynthesis enzyme
MVTKPRKAKPDRCQPLRDAIAENAKEMASIGKSLADPKIPDSTKRRLEALLKRLEALDRRLQRDLQTCEAIPVNPLRK